MSFHQERFMAQMNAMQQHCEPSTWLAASALVLSAAGTGLSLQQQKNNAEAQSEYQTELTKSNNKIEQLKASELRQQEAQLNESSAREQERARLAAQDAKAATVAALGDSAISGATVTQLLAEHDMQLGQYREALRRQNDIDRAAIDSSVQTGTLSAFMSSKSINAPVTGPNYAAGLANFAGQALGIYRDWRNDSYGPRKTSSTK